MGTQIAAPVLRINNNTVAHKANTIEYDEGLGEQNVYAASLGGGLTEQIYSDDVETAFSTVEFELPSTITSVNLVRDWKIKKNTNRIEIEQETPDGSFTRIFTQASVLNNYKVGLGTDKMIKVEMKGNPAK